MPQAGSRRLMTHGAQEEQIEIKITEEDDLTGEIAYRACRGSRKECRFGADVASMVLVGVAR